MDWTIVYTTRDPWSGELVKQILEENQIEVVSLNKKDSSYHFGDISLYVPNEKFNLAIEVLISHDLEQ